MTYTERLRPPLLWWVVGYAFGLTFVIAVAAILPWEIAVASLVTVTLLIAGVLLGTAPVVGVADGTVLARGARLPLSAVGQVTVLEGAALRHRLGVAADPRAYLVYRAFCAGAVEIEVLDPDDPHPYWLVSSGHPAEFAAAIESARTSAQVATQRAEG